MLKVTLTFKELDLAETLKQGKEVRKVTTSNHIVASTKSYNNLIDDLKHDNKIATESVTEDLFVDKKATEKAVTEFIATQIKEKDTAEYVSNHIMKALDGACVFKKPPVVRKKS